MRRYARLGVGEGWLVDPDAASIEVRDLQSGTATFFRSGEKARSATLAGFAVDVTELFAV